MRPLFTQEVLHAPRGPKPFGAPRMGMSYNFRPPFDPRTVLTYRMMPRNPAILLALWAFLLGFAVGTLIRLLVIDPWLAQQVYQDLRTTPPLGELEPAPVNWGPANQENGAELPLVWPVGFTTDLPNAPSRITITGSVTVFELDENDELVAIGIGAFDPIVRDDLIVGTIGITSEVVNGGLNTRTTIQNVSPTGQLEDVAQLVGSYNYVYGGFGINLSPLGGPSPGKPYPAPPVGAGLPNGFRPNPAEIPRPRPIPAFPGVAPQPMTTPATSPQTLPLPQPARPTLPSTPGTPQTVPRPAPSPVIPAQPATTPRPVPVPIPLLPNFAPAPVPVPPVVQVPVGLEVPWPGAQPIGQEAKRPPPTLTGIATELGKLEEKVAQIGARGPGFDIPGLIESIGNLINDPPEYNYPAGEYTLPPICERDSEGRPLPAKRAQWPSGSGEIAELRAKLDALAKLIRFHKEWKQPICPPERSMPQGQPVTVTFEQIPAQP